MCVHTPSLAFSCPFILLAAILILLSILSISFWSLESAPKERRSFPSILGSSTMPSSLFTVVVVVVEGDGATAGSVGDIFLILSPLPLLSIPNLECDT